MFETIKLALYFKYKLLKVYAKKYFWHVKTLLFFPQKDVVLISFYADYEETERYKKAAIKLSEKLKKWKIPFIIESVKDRGGYKNNTLYKPTFIQNQINILKKTVIWIDCDTDPFSPEAIYKIAKDINSFTTISESMDRRGMLVGLLKFKFDDFGLRVLESWKLYCDYVITKEINELDHEALRDAVLPNFEVENKIGYIPMKGKLVGFKSSTLSDNGVVKIQKSLIDNEEREKLVTDSKALNNYLDKF